MCCAHIFLPNLHVLPPSLIYTRVLIRDEFEILAAILLIIMAGANILFCI